MGVGMGREVGRDLGKACERGLEREWRRLGREERRLERWRVRLMEREEGGRGLDERGSVGCGRASDRGEVSGWDGGMDGKIADMAGLEGDDDGRWRGRGFVSRID